MSTRVRPPAVAGLFYPAHPGELAALVDRLLQSAPSREGSPAHAVIAPHAGYVYSGAVAAAAYTRLDPTARRVVIVGPAHRVPFAGIAVPTVDAFATPLGDVVIDGAARAVVLDHPAVRADDEAHAPEHSIEVHLPFIQRAFGPVEVLPLLAGRADASTVADVLQLVWGGSETAVVVSSDLSHYHPDTQARQLDRRTAAAVVARDVDSISVDDACGAIPIRGVLEIARRRDLDVELVALATSADAAGPADRVVGYGAFAVR